MSQRESMFNKKYSEKKTNAIEESQQIESAEELKNSDSFVGAKEQQYTFENLAFFFSSQPPFAFRPRKNNLLDIAIGKNLRNVNSKVPVCNINKNLYLIGTQRLNCEEKFGTVFIKVGGGKQKLEDYLTKNEGAIRKQIVDLMVKHQIGIESIL